MDKSVNKIFKEAENEYSQMLELLKLNAENIILENIKDQSDVGITYYASLVTKYREEYTPIIVGVLTNIDDMKKIIYKMNEKLGYLPDKEVFSSDLRLREKEVLRETLSEYLK